ncbi:hypothetical protein AB0J83_19925 [Actinoplanes sp. NPDC049596]
MAEELKRVASVVTAKMVGRLTAVAVRAGRAPASGLAAADEQHGRDSW